MRLVETWALPNKANHTIDIYDLEEDADAFSQYVFQRWVDTPGGKTPVGHEQRFGSLQAVRSKAAGLGYSRVRETA